MERNLWRRAMRRAVWGALAVAAVTALVVAPSFTVIGGLLTLLLLFTGYPLFLLVAYGLLGWLAGAGLGAEAAPLPRWRAALALGGGAALTLTLVLVATAVALGLALAGFLGVFGALNDQNDPFGTFLSFFGLSLYVAGIYLLGALTLGLLCAWLGAWTALRFRSLSPPTTGAGAL